MITSLFRTGVFSLSLVFLTVLVPTATHANDAIGFIERFALAEDRAAAVQELVPGTEEYYYYSALLAQQEGRLDSVSGILEPWIKRHGESNRVREIRHRQALLEYPENPEKSLAYLKKHLGLNFNHQQQKLDAKPDFPIELAPELVTWEAYLERAMRPNSLGQVTQAGLDRLVRDEVVLNPGQRRELLQRLLYPDYSRLVGMIAADLRTKESKGFGEFPIHLKLTDAQLDELAGLHPDLRKSKLFIDAKLQRLRPNGDVSLDLEPEARRAYLDRLWEFTSELDSVFNSLKAAVLYRKLEEARNRGEYPTEDFLTYLRLPRRMAYMQANFLHQQLLKQRPANLDEDFKGTIGFAPIGNDEPLVRSFLEHYFKEEDSIDRFSPYIRESYLEPLFAETKLIHGVGDPEEWFSMLPPSRVQELRERVEIAFLPSNREHFPAGDEVTLAVNIKNVENLLVKVYEINALNFYRDHDQELNTDLDLDGLVANEEKTYRYDLPPIRRHSEVFTFESLKGKRGIWVVEFIGNGISSRALVRKGKLQYLSAPSPGGELIQVLNESNEVVKDPSIWFGGKRYTANEDGLVLLPFSESGEVPVVLMDGEFATFARIDLPRETYTFSAGMFVEQETLLPGREAAVLIRPRLSIQGEPVSTSLLEQVTLRVATTDLDGVESVSEAKDFVLSDDSESIHRFRVPPRLRSIAVHLSAEIPLISRSGEEQSLTARRVFDVNGVDAARVVSDMHLGKVADGFLLELLGKTGEPVSERPVHFSFQHRDFTEGYRVTLKTDEEGRVRLGALEDILSVSAQAGGIGERQWNLEGGRYSHPSTLHAVAGEEITLPFPDLGEDLERSDFAFFEVRGGVLYRDLFDQAKAAQGAISIPGLGPGDYLAVDRIRGETRRLLVTRSESAAFGYSLSRSRHLQKEEALPPDIHSVEEKGGSITVQVERPDDRTRIHVFATRFLPTLPPFEALQAGPLPPLYRVTRGSNDSLYVSGRDIGEEYRYILDRRGAKRFPGNMLPRPGLILNPWALNETETAIEDAEAGEDYKRGGEMKAAKKEKPGAPEPAARPRSRQGANSPSLQFFANQAVVLANLEVNEAGVVEIDAESLGDRHHLHIVVANGTHTASEEFVRGERDEDAIFRDLRLQETLDREKTFTQRRNVTLLKKGEVLTIEDLRSAEMETYGTIAEVYGTLAAMNPDSDFLDFGFLVGWPNLEEAKKRELYSEFASHELNFFLSKKDPEFFREVVQPYITNKKDPTFLDRYLVDAPLDSYLAPWEFGRLNIVERILLARRIGEQERARTADHVRGLQDLIPPDAGRDAMVYRQALRGRRSSGDLGNAVAGGLALGFADGGGGGASADPFAALADSRGGVRAPAAPMSRSAAADPFAAPVSAADREEPKVMRESAPAEERADGLGVVATRGTAMAGRRIAGLELREQGAKDQLYRKLESTREWAENNYYHLPVAEQTGDLITVNAFWEDFAEWDGEGGFYSREFPAATRNLSEMIFALSVLDLPFESEDPEISVEETTLRFTANSPVVIFHEEIQEAPLAEKETPVLVSQNFYRADDRFRFEDGRQFDKFVSDEFLTSVVYGSRVVVTNPTSAAHTLELLIQVPQGAIPVGGSDYTKSYPITLMPFSTEGLDVEFYFPETSGEGTFDFYPVQVAMEEKVIASGDPAEFRVVDQLSRVDEASWEYLSQFGTEKEVLDYLSQANLYRINLSLVAWRARESVDFFRRVTDLVAQRHGFDATLWSYGLHHNILPTAREYLKHREDYLGQCGRWIECDLVSLDPVERHWYQHLEYAPLVNARAHRLGRERSVLNDRFRNQYDSFLHLLSYKNELDGEDRLAVAGYLFLQDRIDDGLAWLDSIGEEQVESSLQHDYLKAYAAFYREDADAARQIAAAYVDHPVERWRSRFQDVNRQALEAAGEEGAPNEEEGRERQMETLSATDAFFELSAEGRTAELVFRNLETVTVNYYEMDLEFLFSSQPFVSGESGQFRYIRPNLTEAKELPVDGDTFAFAVPDRFASKNVLVEVVGGGRSDSVAVYSNRLKVQLSDNYGRLEVRHEESDKPLPRTYVKVYARMNNGEVRFFKDGYTDLRGKFDYVSLNTDELDSVEQLSLLVMSDQNGSLVREVAPPQR